MSPHPSPSHPSPPYPHPSPSHRLTVSLLTSLLLLAALAIAASLDPAPAGHGSHEQLGLPPCATLAVTGYPCPTCGMTTAVAAAAHADWPGALRAQPFAALLALAAATAFWAALHTAIFGSSLPRLAARLLRPRALWAIAALWAASWIWKLVTW